MTPNYIFNYTLYKKHKVVTRYWQFALYSQYIYSQNFFHILDKQYLLQ